MLPTDSTSSRTGTDLTQLADNPLAKQCGLCVPWDPPPVLLLLLLGSGVSASAEQATILV